MKPLLTASLVLASTMVVLWQPAITAKWQGTTRGGSEIVLDLTASNATATGTLNRNNETVPIRDGTLSKTTLTFKATLGDQDESFTGEASQNELKVWLDRVGPDSAVILKRVKK